MTTAALSSVSTVPSSVKPVAASWDCVSYVAGKAWKLYCDGMDNGAKVAKDIIKLISYGSYWARFWNPSTPASLDKLNTDTRHMKNALSMISVPHGIAKVCEKVEKFVNDPNGKNFWNIIGDTSGLITDLCDTVDFAGVYAKIPSEVSTGLSAVNYTSTIIGCGKGAVDQVMNIQTRVTDLTANEGAKATISAEKYEKVKQANESAILSHVMNLVNKVSYVALGSIALTFLVAGFATPVAAIVTCLTVATSFSLTSYFFDKITDWEGKVRDSAQAQLKELASFPRVEARAV